MIRTFFLENRFQKYPDLVILQKYYSLLNQNPMLYFELRFPIFIINVYNRKANAFSPCTSCSFLKDGSKPRISFFSTIYFWFSSKKQKIIQHHLKFFPTYFIVLASENFIRLHNDSPMWTSAGNLYNQTEYANRCNHHFVYLL